MLRKMRTMKALPDRTLGYAEAVLSGAIVAGPHVRNACRRHIDDLKRDGVVFDRESADRAFGFFEGKLRLGEGQFEDQPFSAGPGTGVYHRVDLRMEAP